MHGSVSLLTDGVLQSASFNQHVKVVYLTFETISNNYDAAEESDFYWGRGQHRNSCTHVAFFIYLFITELGGGVLYCNTFLPQLIYSPHSI